MTVTASKLRQNIYKMLDEVAETGVPVEIKRKGAILRIISATPHKKTDNLKKRAVMSCEPDEIVNTDWSETWEG